MDRKVKLAKFRRFRDKMVDWLTDEVEVEVGPGGQNAEIKMPSEVEEAFEEVEDL